MVKQSNEVVPICQSLKNKVARLSCYVTTDKQKYKPGETIYCRAVVLNTFTHQPSSKILSLTNLNLRIVAPDGSIIFGGRDYQAPKPEKSVVCFKWKIPENTAGGEYEIFIEQDNTNLDLIKISEEPEEFDNDFQFCKKPKQIDFKLDHFSKNNTKIIGNTIKRVGNHGWKSLTKIKLGEKETEEISFKINKIKNKNGMVIGLVDSSTMRTSHNYVPCINKLKGFGYGSSNTIQQGSIYTLRYKKGRYNNGKIEVLKDRKLIGETARRANSLGRVKYWGVFMKEVGDSVTCIDEEISGISPLVTPGRRKFDIETYSAPQFKMEITFLKKGYSEGDMCKAQLKVERQEGGFPTNGKCEATARIDGEEVFKQTYDISNTDGTCMISFKLPKEIKEGNGTLSCAVTEGITENTSKTIPIILKKIDCKVYPEGGDLVYGIENGCYIEARTLYGDPADFKGILIEKKEESKEENMLDVVQTKHEGRGVFKFTPKKGNEYFIKVMDPSGVTVPITLPEIKDHGLSIVLKNKKALKFGDTIEVLLTSTMSIGCKIGLFRKEKAISMSDLVHLKGGEQNLVKLDPADVDGCLRMTVFFFQPHFGVDKLDYPIAERLIFVRPKQEVQIDVNLEKKNYAPGEKVNLTLSTALASLKIEGEEKKIASFCSVCVTDDSVVKMVERRNRFPRLLEQVYLEDEVKELKDCPTYFNSIDDLEDIAKKCDGDEAIDLLFGTQGWRRFVYKFYKKDKLFYKNEKSFKEIDHELFFKILSLPKEIEQEIAEQEIPPPPEDDDFFDDDEEKEEEGSDLISNLLANEMTNTRDSLLSNIRSVRPLRKVKKTGRKREKRRYGTRGRGRGRGGGMFMQRLQMAVPKSNAGKKFKKKKMKMKESKSEENAKDSFQFSKRVAPMMSLQKESITSARAIPMSPQRKKESSASISSVSRLSSKRKKKRGGMLGRITNGRIVKSSKRPKRAFFEKKKISAPYPGQYYNETIVQPQHVNILSYVREYAHKSTKKKGKKKTERTDFTETLYFNSCIKVEEDGKSISFALNDKVTSFRVFVDCWTADGKIGSSQKFIISSKKPFYLDPKVPQEISFKDKIKIPVAIVNNLPIKSNCSLNVSTKGLGSHNVLSMATNDWKGKVAENERSVQYFDMEVNSSEINNKGKSKKKGKNAVSFVGELEETGETDKVTKEISVKPYGFPVFYKFSGILKPNTSESYIIELPKTLVQGSLNVMGFLTPSNLSRFTTTLKGLIREPYGCLEQVSSTLLPMIMAVNFFNSNESKLDTHTLAKIKEHLGSGYKKVCGCQLSSGGFDWFGRGSSANEALTALAIDMLTKLRNVFPVSRDIISKATKWLLGRKNKDGKGFKRKPGRWGFGYAPDDTQNAYIAWCLSETGIGFHKVSGVLEDLYTKMAKRGNGKADCYIAALVSLSYFNYGKYEEARNFCNLLTSYIEKDGSIVKCNTTFSKSGGINRRLEVSGLSCLAFLNFEEFSDYSGQLIKFIQKHNSVGRYGSTQSTTLCIRAIQKYYEGSSCEENGKVSIIVNDAPVSALSVSKKSSKKIKFEDFSRNLVTHEENKIEIKSEIKSPIPFSMQVACKIDTPPTDLDSLPFTFENSLSSTVMKEGESNEVNVVLKNKTKDVLSMTTAVVSLPGGLEVRTKKLKELMKMEKFAYYELWGARDIVFYWRGIAPEEEIKFAFDVTAKIPGNFTGDASRCYLYYDDTNRYYLKGLEVDIKPANSK